MDGSSHQEPPTTLALNRSAEALDDPQQAPLPFEQDRQSRIAFELRTYGDLINLLLDSIQDVESRIEPFIGARLRSNIIITHRHEAKRLELLHGQHQLRATLTGAAWNVVGFDGSADGHSSSVSQRRPLSLSHEQPSIVPHVRGIVSYTQNHELFQLFLCARISILWL